MKPRITPDQLDKLLAEYREAVSNMTLASLSLSPDRAERAADWNAIAHAKAREIREGVFP
jgi:hypothetical protein